MGLCRFGLAALLAGAIAAPAAAQQSTVTVDGDNVTFMGCLARVTANPSLVPNTVIWSRGDIMLAAAAAAGAVPAPVGTTGFTERIFYWLEDDEDLARYVGQRVEIRGDLEDFETGQVEIEREDDVVEIELQIRDDREELRLPVAWFGANAPTDEKEFEIVVRRVDVEDVRVLGACGP